MSNSDVADLLAELTETRIELLELSMAISAYLLRPYPTFKDRLDAALQAARDRLARAPVTGEK